MSIDYSDKHELGAIEWLVWNRPAEPGTQLDTWLRVTILGMLDEIQRLKQTIYAAEVLGICFRREGNDEFADRLAIIMGTDDPRRDLDPAAFQ